MKVAVLFTYDVIEKNKNLEVKFHRGLRGFTDYSQFGKYKYKRPGLLTTIPHLTPTRSCIIVREKDASLLREFFKKYKVKWDERRVLLSKEEIKNLEK